MFLPDARMVQPALFCAGAPLESVDIDYAHPLTDGLVAFYLFNGGGYLDLCSRKFDLLPHAGVSAGFADYSISSQLASDVIGLLSDDVLPVGSLIIHGHDYHLANNPGWAIHLEVRDSAGNYLLRHAHLTTDNSIRVYLLDDAQTYIVPAGIDLSRETVSCFKFDGNSGVSAIAVCNHRDSATHSPVSPSSNEFLKVGARYTYNDLPAGRLYAMAFYDRWLSDVEDAAMRGNPYQILTPV